LLPTPFDTVAVAVVLAVTANAGSANALSEAAFASALEGMLAGADASDPSTI
jgi:hypothetical protein